ncbi:hypothetical protein [Thalassotalea castellviae]|uniref:Bacteriocin n=1 Tax=Thalassotalea castellviae TaxID=3075612 RepID=A0ABU2ZYA6_9GAMM|nr:hypothetical protein [Thalassotalea sp. W431]MDT0602540.1 hypothetical protein [Thalassotalea sp. W431]
MTTEKAITCGLAGNEISKSITGSSDVTASRTVVAASSGAVLGACASGAATVALGLASTPVTIPLVVASGLVAGIASLFD